MRPIVAPAPAASLLLVRDTPDGLEVLVLERSRRLEFASGMLVFPGGRVDPQDGGRALAGSATTGGARGPGDLAFRLAALRELFEEAGLLLARQKGRMVSLGEVRRAMLARRYRDKLHRGTLSFARFAARSGLVFDTKKLVPFAHWVTPELAPKRFDTRFYLAPAPLGQLASSDGVESLSHAWRRPKDILAAWNAGVEPLMFPTRLNLMKLARAETVAEAMAQARATPIIQVMPEVVDGGKRRLVIPIEAGFGVTEATHEDLDPLERAALDAHLDALAKYPWKS